MNISDKAIEKLEEMIRRLGGDIVGFRIAGFMGTCHGSTPVIEPVKEIRSGDIELVSEPLHLFVVDEYADQLEDAELDYDRSFMGRGLTMTWPHREGCMCQRRAAGGAERPG